MSPRIIKYSDQSRHKIIEIWEESVRATHLFLREEDILFYKSEVEGTDFNKLSVYCAVSEDNNILGFHNALD